MNIKKFENEIVPYLKNLGFKKCVVNSISTYTEDIHDSEHKYSEMVLSIKVFGVKGYIIINFSRIDVDTVNGNILTKKTTYKSINNIIEMLHNLPNSWVMFKNKGFKS